MQQLVRRQCQSQKECSDCRKVIANGEFYYGNPNMTLCEPCKEKRENKEKSVNVMDDIADIEEGNKYVDYTGTCVICGNRQTGEVYHIPVCANTECNDKLYTEK